MTNIKLNIQAAGKQIIAYEIDSNTKNLIENNSFKDKAMSCIDLLKIVHLLLLFYLMEYPLVCQGITINVHIKLMMEPRKPFIR